MKRLILAIVVLLASCQKKECVYIDGHWKMEVTYYNNIIKYKATDSVYLHCYIDGTKMTTYRRTPNSDEYVGVKYIDINNIISVNKGEFKDVYSFRLPEYYSIYKKIE